MSQGIRIPLAAAEQLAASVLRELAPGCDRIELAGSIRRRKKSIGDIEIVAIPKTRADLLGEHPQSLLDPILMDLVQAGRLRRIKGGERYKCYELPKHGMKLDLFLVTPERWACIYTIRTGPAEFSAKLVRSRNLDGYMPTGWKVFDGRLWDHGNAVELSEETDLFSALNIPWIDPEHR